MTTRLASSLALVLGLALLPVVAGAQSTPTPTATAVTATPTPATSIRDKVKAERDARSAALDSYKASLKNATTTRKLAAAKDLANKLIDERIKAIEQATTAGNIKNCSAAAQADAAAVGATVTANLNGQKTKVTVATTLDQVKTIIKDGIIGQNHVFVAFLPAIRGMCASDSIIALIDGRLTTLVKTLKNAGLDTLALEKNLTDAKTAAKLAYDMFKKAAGNTGAATYKDDLAAARAKLVEARAALAAAKDEAGKLKSQLEAKTTPTPTVTTTSTVTSTPTSMPTATATP